jgi:hypothetical protein
MTRDTRNALFLSRLSKPTGTSMSQEPASVVPSDKTPGFALAKK